MAVESTVGSNCGGTCRLQTKAAAQVGARFQSLANVTLTKFKTSCIVLEAPPGTRALSTFSWAEAVPMAGRRSSKTSSKGTKKGPYGTRSQNVRRKGAGCTLTPLIAFNPD